VGLYFHVGRHRIEGDSRHLQAGFAELRQHELAARPSHKKVRAGHVRVAGPRNFESLRRLARISDPREYRITGGRPDSKTLVHGDYFSANILPVTGGLRIIDWETFGWGDPMWDLGYLVGADRNLPEYEVEAVVTEYEKLAPVNREHLTRISKASHRECCQRLIIGIDRRQLP